MRLLNIFKRTFRIEKKDNQLYYLQERKFFKWRDIGTKDMKLKDANYNAILKLSARYVITHAVNFKNI